MRIKKIISQNHRDFRAIFQCEHCGGEYEMGGYNDVNFHINETPQLECRECGKKAQDDYSSLTPKYPKGYQI